VTDLLNKAFDAASRLPSDEQNALAEWLLAELASEDSWRERFAETHDSLSVLIREALNEHERQDRRAEPRLALRSTTTRRFRKAFSRLPGPVKDRAREAYRRFVENPNHPGLRFKQVHPTQPVYSVRISQNYRALGVREGDTMVWF
jgi:hypothetical protein